MLYFKEENKFCVFEYLHSYIFFHTKFSSTQIVVFIYKQGNRVLTFHPHAKSTLPTGRSVQLRKGRDGIRLDGAAFQSCKDQAFRDTPNGGVAVPGTLGL